ncbi:hypothetical protein P376_0240 [Streptomyces sp. HCCB10043]|nr:hypothetical protein P376_0240 [Streptomyces sp. HCCB10043]
MCRSPVENSPQAKGPATAVSCAWVMRICRRTGQAGAVGMPGDRTARTPSASSRRSCFPRAHPCETAVQMPTGIVHLSPTEQDRKQVWAAVFPELRPHGYLGVPPPPPAAAISPFQPIRRRAARQHP